MTTLFILLSILLLIILLLLARVRFCFSYDGSFSLTLRHILLRIPLYPRKPRAKKARQKREKPKGSSHSVRPSAKKEKKPLRIGEIKFLLGVVREVAESIFERASRHVRIVIRELKITVGGADDAARAAIEYGLLSQSVSYLLAYLDNTGFLAPPRQGAVDIETDFLARGHSLRVRTEIACPLLFLIPLLLVSLSKALAAKGKWTRYRTRVEKQIKEALNAKGG
ncbi:MAG: hypothetical protein J6V07_03715 [Clostridia bacterium]|nr:hypothetical protein [Clostridia bacterium]